MIIFTNLSYLLWFFLLQLLAATKKGWQQQHSQLHFFHNLHSLFFILCNGYVPLKISRSQSVVCASCSRTKHTSMRHTSLRTPLNIAFIVVILNINNRVEKVAKKKKKNTSCSAFVWRVLAIIDLAGRTYFHISLSFHGTTGMRFWRKRCCQPISYIKSKQRPLAFPSIR